nr:Chain C, Lambda N [synthetic construct]
NRPILSL